MAIQQGDVSLDISAQLTNIDQAIKELDEKLSQGSKKSGKKLEENLNGSINNVSNYIRDNLGKVVGGLSFAYIGYKLGSEIKNGIKNALDSEISTKRLENSLLNVGITSSKVKDDIISFADSFKRISSIDDDAITNKFTIASGAGASVEQYKKIVTASLGFAQATGEDFNSVFDKITRTLSGSAGRIGLTVSGFNSLTEAQLKAGKGIDFLAERYGSFAGQEVTALSGAFKVLENSVNKVFEGFGFLVASSPSLVALVKTLSDEFFNLSENIEKTSKQGDAFNPIIENGFILADIAYKIGGAFQVAIGAIQVFTGFAFNAISAPIIAFNQLRLIISDVVLGLGNLTKNKDLITTAEEMKVSSDLWIESMADTKKAIYDLGRGNIKGGLGKIFADSSPIDDFKVKYEKTLSELIEKKKENDKLFSENGSTSSRISNISKSGAGIAIPKKDFIEQNLQSVLNSVNLSPINVQLETGSISAVESTLGSFKTVYDEFGNSVLNTNSLLSNSITQINDSFKDGASVAIDATRRSSEEIAKGNTVNQLASQTQKIEELAKSMGSTVKTTITNAIVGGVQKLVGGLIKGGLNFKDFAGFVFDLLGDMAIQMGTFAISAGIAIESIGSLSGAKAVIAGIALVALGTIIKSFLGGGSGSSASSAGAGAQSASTGTSGGGGLVATDTATTQVAQEQERRVGQVVNIEVQGNMIDDNNKFAKFVAETLNRGFESDDIKLINGIVA